MPVFLMHLDFGNGNIMLGIHAGFVHLDIKIFLNSIYDFAIMLLTLPGVHRQFTYQIFIVTKSLLKYPWHFVLTFQFMKFYCHM